MPKHLDILLVKPHSWLEKLYCKVTGELYIDALTIRKLNNRLYVYGVRKGRFGMLQEYKDWKQNKQVTILREIPRHLTETDAFNRTKALVDYTDGFAVGTLWKLIHAIIGIWLLSSKTKLSCEAIAFIFRHTFPQWGETTCTDIYNNPDLKQINYELPKVNGTPN